MLETNSGNGGVHLGTISGTSVSFATKATFQSSNAGQGEDMGFSICSSNASDLDRVLIAYQDIGNSRYGTAIVYKPSDGTFGSKVVFESAQTQYMAAAYDSNSDRVVIAYEDDADSDKGKAIVGSVSDTSVSFGSVAEFSAGQISRTNIAFDSSNNKIVIFYQKGPYGTHGEKMNAIVGTVSGTSISFGSEVEVSSGSSRTVQGLAFDSNANKMVAAWRNSDNSGYLEVAVGTVSGTSISFGTTLVTSTIVNMGAAVAFNPDRNKVALAYHDDSNSSKLTVVEGTVSGTDITLGSSMVVNTNTANEIRIGYDTNADKFLVAYEDDTDSNNGCANVLTAPFEAENLTTENFIGTSAHSAADGAKVLVNTQGAIDENIPQIVQTVGFGSVVQYDSSNLSTGDSNALAFDSSNNKVVLIYRDNGNSNYGTALVGTIDTSDDSISWGSATVFESASIGGTSLTFDSSNNKVVGFFKDIGDSNKMKGIVGTVSGTSISFGSATDVSTAGADFAAATFDTNSNKVVVAFTDSNNSGYGTARVGTVSGTSISFGTAVVYTSAEANHEADSITFDSSNNRVVIAYTLSSGTNRGNAIVGTVSGTDISFGTQVAFNANFSGHQTATFDTSNNKVVIAFQDSSNSDQGTAVVGTVDPSDNSISFGSEAIFNAAGTDTISSTFDSTSNTVLIAYRDAGDSSDGVVIVGTVSGTSISFGSENKYSTGTAYRNRIIYDSNAKRAVVIYSEGDQSNRGDSIVFRPAANLDLIAGQTYFVQTDGSLSETADSPSVTAGTALSATKLLVKG